ncbi:MAG TPA: aminoglycoside phosphotransferase family protein [Acidimicrobiales bacterium]|nr:aminoglycoside phosphotransferase family protein [Acidimicrobiales bacterium]
MRSLLRSQFPDLATLDIVEIASGWDNVIFRVGDELTARLPRREVAAVLIEHEQRWLPTFADRLPLPIPVPLRAGQPALGYPWRWSICPWLPGETALRAPVSNRDAADALGQFVASLSTPAPPDAPTNPLRGIPLAGRTERLEMNLHVLGDAVDDVEVRALWCELVATPAWDGPAMWIHGDLHPGNVLVDNGQLAAVIDFGDLTGGDPAMDLSAAWMFFPPEIRPTFRAAAGGCDDATWARARGWALAFGIACLASSADNEEYTALGRHTTEEALRNG